MQAADDGARRRAGRLARLCLDDRYSRPVPSFLIRGSGTWAHTRTQTSGEVSRVGRLSLRGDAMMRRLLYEAAQSMMTRVVKWCWLKAWAMKIAKRHGSKKAKVALARRLAVVMHRMWVDGSEFRWTREDSVSTVAA